MSIDKNKVIYVSEIMLSLDQFPVVSSEVYLKEALEKMNKIQLGIACIVDSDNKLIGVLTDGDIRRFLIKGFKISSSVIQAMNSEFTYLNIKSPKEKIAKIFKEGSKNNKNKEHKNIKCIN